MSFDRLAELRKAKPYLVHQHGYSAADVLVLYAITEMENQTAQKNTAAKIEEKGGPKNFDPSKMTSTWCRKSALTLARENGLSESQVQASVAMMVLDGVLHADRRGANIATRRAINRDAINLINRYYTGQKFEDVCPKGLKIEKRARYSDFGWTRYLTPNEVAAVEIDFAHQQRWADDSSYAIQAPNLLEAAKIIEKFKDRYPLTVDLRRNKDKTVVPYVARVDACQKDDIEEPDQSNLAPKRIDDKIGTSFTVALEEFEMSRPESAREWFAFDDPLTPEEYDQLPPGNPGVDSRTEPLWVKFRDPRSQDITVSTGRYDYEDGRWVVKFQRGEEVDYCLGIVPMAWAYIDPGEEP